MSGIFKPLSPKYYDTTNSLTSGLVFDAQFSEGAGTTGLDLANNVSGSLAGLGGPTWEKKDYGHDLLYTDNTNIVNYTSVAAQNSLANISVEALVYPTANNGANDARIIHKGNSTKYFYLGYLSSTGNRFQCGQEYNTSEVNVTSNVITFSQWTHVIVTIVSATANGTGINFYVNGASSVGSIVATGTGTAPSDTTELFVGNRGSAYGSTKGVVGRIGYVRYWNRILSATEANNLYMNPWRIYANPFVRNILRPAPFRPGIAR